MSRRDPEQQRFILEIRRSNAASRHRNRKKYRRKMKHRLREAEHA